MKKFLITLLALTSVNAWAATATTARPSAARIEFELNRGSQSNVNTQLGTQITRNKIQLLKATYDYAVQGGASTASIALLDYDGKAAQLPANSIIKQVLIDVKTPITQVGTGGTYGLTVNTFGDLKATNTLDTALTGLVAGVPVGTAATMIKLDSARGVYASFGVASISAGKFNVFLEYYLSN